MLAGCFDPADNDTDGVADGDETSDGADTNDTGSFPAYNLPMYSEWLPPEPQTGDELFFTHVDWASMQGTNGESDPADEEVDEVVDRVPIVGLPLYGAVITPFAIFGILFYPFAGHILPDDGEDPAGIETTHITWTNKLLIFHGEYDHDVFAEEYSEGFTEAEERDGFTVFVGDEESTDGMAFAVSEETLVAGMMPGEEEAHVPEDVVTAALDRGLGEADRLIDQDDGLWLFETTGEAQMVLGAWETDDLMGTLDPDAGTNDDIDAPDPDVQANPVYDEVESVVNTLVFDLEDEEIGNLEARFAGIYPDGAVPTEDEVREHLIGEEDVPHDIVIEDNRVHASAQFEDIVE